jgi:hypothetical protein
VDDVFNVDSLYAQRRVKRPRADDASGNTMACSGGPLERIVRALPGYDDMDVAGCLHGEANCSKKLAIARVREMPCTDRPIREHDPESGFTRRVLRHEVDATVPTSLKRPDRDTTAR